MGAGVSAKEIFHWLVGGTEERIRHTRRREDPKGIAVPSRVL
jgi:hypothetical protein